MTTQTTKLEQDESGFRLTLFVPPVPASRPRVSKWGTYYAKTYSAWRKQAHLYIPQCDPALKLEGLVGVRIEFVCTKPKTTKRITPNGDIDNHMKSILDAVTQKEYWRDDMDIAEGHVSKRFAEPGEEPHTTISAWIIP